ncbi:UDP-N-acetylmuramoyl-tripeptide--D-alanyl-D-alanine ligase [Candidatus Roizmanbacteria bacterium]|nr:MAG: UDP-N-acetylmuramoyl-tripeptide--D-alanyl-D-alanine ligase [Candidatus Roizmanbacteria bacterium]
MSYQPQGIKKIYHTLKRNLAAVWLNQFHPVQLAITGSQGKTNTTGLVTQVLEQFGPTVRTDISLDTTFNVPITALKVRPWTKYVVWELGIDHPGEMDHHHEIAHPSIACITGISAVHTDEEHMGSLETLIREKRKIIEHLPKSGTAILNHDNEYTKGMANHTKAAVQWFGMTPDCTMWTDPKSIKLTLAGTSATCYLNEGNTSRAIEMRTGLIGAFHFYNIMNAYLMVRAAVLDRDITATFVKVVRDMKPLQGRMSVEDGPLGTVLLNDSLRASPGSTKAGLESLELMEYSKGRKIAVIGEMGELADPEKEHRKTGEQIAAMHFDYVLCIGPLRKFTINEAIKRGFPENKIGYAKDVFEAADILKRTLRKNDLWYLKGSLLRNYNRILKILRGEKVCCDAVLCPYEHCS